MDVIGAPIKRAPHCKELTMKTFVLTSDRNITAFPSRKTAAATGDPIFSTVEEMAEIFRLAKVTPLEIWNTLPGVTPVKKFTDRATAMARIWKQLANLEVSPDFPQSAEPTTLAQSAAVTPQTAHTPRPGSKQEQVLQLLKRSNGATLGEIANATGWQRHTVRGFIAGTVKTKLRLVVESFKTEAGERSYRVKEF
jgi:Protein of unknown function (DUF3489)